MSRFHQRLREDLNNPEFAQAFYNMSADIALLQVPEEALNASRDQNQPNILRTYTDPDKGQICP